MLIFSPFLGCLSHKLEHWMRDRFLFKYLILRFVLLSSGIFGNTEVKLNRHLFLTEQSTLFLLLSKQTNVFICVLYWYLQHHTRLLCCKYNQSESLIVFIFLPLSSKRNPRRWLAGGSSDAMTTQAELALPRWSSWRAGESRARAAAMSTRRGAFHPSMTSLWAGHRA